MKLCLDEHYSVEIAATLRSQDQDVCAVKERADLIGLGDPELWTRLIGERRGLLTENVGDFMPLVHQTAAAGDSHYGLVLSSPRSMPRSRATIGLFVERLSEVLLQHPGDEDLRDRVVWLEP